MIFLVLFGVAGLVALGNFWKHKLGTLMFLGLLGFGVLSGAASGAISGKHKTKKRLFSTDRSYNLILFFFLGYALSLVYSTANFTVPTWIPLAMFVVHLLVCLFFVASYFIIIFLLGRLHKVSS